MNFWTGDITITGSGNTNFGGIPFLPVGMILTVGAKNSDTVAHHMWGSTDGTRQKVRCCFADTTGAKSDKSSTKCLLHYDRVAGTIQAVLDAAFVSFNNNGGGDFGFTLNITTGSSSYPVVVTAFG